MLNLIAYQDSSISFLNRVVASKRKGSKETPPYYKDRIVPLAAMIHSAYSNYDNAFSSNNLHTITSNVTFTKEQKADMLKLYNYDSKPFTILKNIIISRPNNYAIHTCQYCTINTINTLDHVMPKEDYPAFVIHPKNLIPACGQCNSYKSTKWMTNGFFEFLNPYLHHLPLEQFLFANIKYVNGTFEVNFYLNNSNQFISAYLFAVIQNHFRNLHLLKRYKEVSHKFISQFNNTIQGAITTQSLQDALISARKTIQLNQALLGYNYYENVLALELCNGPAYRQYCQAQGY